MPCLQYSELRALATLHASNGDAAAGRASREAAEQLQQKVLKLLWREDMRFLGTLKVSGSSVQPAAARLQSR